METKYNLLYFAALFHDVFINSFVRIHPLTFFFKSLMRLSTSRATEEEVITVVGVGVGAITVTEK